MKKAVILEHKEKALNSLPENDDGANELLETLLDYLPKVSPSPRTLAAVVPVEVADSLWPVALPDTVRETSRWHLEQDHGRALAQRGQTDGCRGAQGRVDARRPSLSNPHRTDIDRSGWSKMTSSWGKSVPTGMCTSRVASSRILVSLAAGSEGMSTDTSHGCRVLRLLEADRQVALRHSCRCSPIQRENAHVCRAYAKALPPSRALRALLVGDGGRLQSLSS